MNIVANKVSVVLVAYVFVILFTILNAWMTYNNAQVHIINSLQLQSLAAAHSIETSLKESFDLTNKIFRDLATVGNVGIIAYAALYDKTATVMFHSNDELVGSKVHSPLQEPLNQSQTFFFENANNQRLFVIDMPVNLHGFAVILRVAIYTNQTMKIMKQVHVYLVGAFAVIVIASVIVFLYTRAIKKSEALEQEIQRQKQFAVLGEMAAILAHEIRNPLGSIKGFAQYLHEKSQSAELEIIINEASRLEKLTSALLSYCKPYELQKTTFSLRELLDECIAVVSPPNTAKLEITVDNNDIMIHADKDKLKQALVNILQNAVDAINYNGKITLTASKQGDMLEIIISDNGIGMDTETVTKALNPFFTTKAKGTGLGLPICERLINVHNGQISIKSSLAQGTSVIITLPQ